jgi:hypothetical protein
MAHFGESWVGQEPAHAEGDRVGLLLDLGAGSMAVYKNDAWLGVIATGLTGPYVWVATLFGQGDSARIDSVPMPGLAATAQGWVVADGNAE